MCVITEEKSSTKVLPEQQKSKLSAKVKKTPFKYNGSQNYTAPKPGAKYCINLDWLEFTLRGQFIRLEEKSAGVFTPPNVLVYCNGDIHLERDPERWNGTKHYKYVYLVFAHGEQVGTILTSPRNTSVLKDDLSQFKFENHVLYRKGCIELFDEIVQAIGLQVNNVTQIHIAVDGFGFIDQFEKVMDGKLKKVGRAKVKAHFDGDMVTEGFDVGSRASAKYLTCYKKASLLKKENKPYILKKWEKEGLVNQSNIQAVERLEAKVKSAYLKEIEGFDYKRLEDPAYLAGIMQKALHKFYEFVTPGTDSNISRNERIQAVNWSYFDALEVKKLKRTEKPPNVIWRLKQRVAFDMLEYYAKVDKRAPNLFEQVYASNRELCYKYGVLDWFDRKLKYWQGLREYQLAIIEEREKAIPRNKVYQFATSFR